MNRGIGFQRGGRVDPGGGDRIGKAAAAALTQPALKNGHPVAVLINVAINFHMY